MGQKFEPMVIAFAQSDFALNFLSLFLEGAPYILLGTLISGFIDVYMPSSVFERLLPKNRVLAVMSCGLMGLILPVCECAVVPVIRRLVAKGLPVSCAFTYMLAAPIINPITVWSTWHAFYEQDKVWMVASRCGMGYLVAVVVGLLMMALPLERVVRKSILRSIRSVKESKQVAHECCGHEHDEGGCGHDHGHGESPSRVAAAMRSGMRDCVDVGVYFTIGVCLAAMFNILYNENQAGFESVLSSPVAELGGMMGLAFVLSACSTSDAFLAAAYNFVGNGAKMAFMVLGPMLDVKLLFLYQTVMRKRFLLIFSVFLFVFIGLLSWGWEKGEVLREPAAAVEKWISSEEDSK